jgi:hypothetical protein
MISYLEAGFRRRNLVGCLGGILIVGLKCPEESYLVSVDSESFVKTMYSTYDLQHGERRQVKMNDSTVPSVTALNIFERSIVHSSLRCQYSEELRWIGVSV